MQTVPERVVTEAKPEEPPAKPSRAEDETPAALRDQYSALAEAASKLRALRANAEQLARLEPNDARARKLLRELALLDEQLAASWQLAGRVAGIAARKASWTAQHARLALRKAVAVQPATTKPVASALTTAALER